MRDFFIVGHNPNTVTDAMNYLRAGANAPEPDDAGNEEDG
jgi:hypothetical protein